MDNVICTK